MTVGRKHSRNAQNEVGMPRNEMVTLNRSALGTQGQPPGFGAFQRLWQFCPSPFIPDLGVVRAEGDPHVQST